MKITERLKRLKIETYAIYLATKDSRVRWYVKVLLLVLIGYELSPLDVFPAKLDDLVLVPLIVWLATRLLPRDVLEDSRKKAVEWIEQDRSIKSWIAGTAVAVVLLLFSAWLLCELWSWIVRGVAYLELTGLSTHPIWREMVPFYAWVRRGDI